jgi:hypothetical protein
MTNRKPGVATISNERLGSMCLDQAIHKTRYLDILLLKAEWTALPTVFQGPDDQQG